MDKRSVAALVCLFVVAPSAPYASGAQTSSGPISEGAAIQVATTQYIFHSASVGRDYLIKVTAPLAPAPMGRKLPVIYAMDQGYEVTGPIAWLLGGSGAMAPAYVVTVGYQPQDYDWRDHDLAFRKYTDGGREINDGAAAFNTFLVEELRPFIREHYPVDDAEAVLFGHSEGGLFAANILATTPNEFAGYLIASPSVWSDPTIVARLRAGAAKIHGRRIFVSVGSRETPEMVHDEHRIADALNAAPHDTTVASRVFKGGTHLSYYPDLAAKALPWLLRP